MADMERRLVEEARKAMEAAFAPYSGYKVGAALLCRDGRIFTGCNVEFATYGATVCAERTALCKAVSEGARDFTHLAVISSGEGVCTPCGICRQCLYEFSRDLVVLCADARGEYEEHKISELLPFGFFLIR